MKPSQQDLAAAQRRQRRGIVVAALVTLPSVAICVRIRRFGWAAALAVAGLAVILVYWPASYVVGLQLRRLETERELRNHFGSRYDVLSTVLLEGLMRIDPFQNMYGRSARGRHRDHRESYGYDVASALREISRIPPAQAAPATITAAIFRALSDNAFGNRWGEVGREDRYAELGMQVWEVLDEQNASRPG